jgi:DNA polymerase III sliding clamp (beta) subunit (PCNA family)
MKISITKTALQDAINAAMRLAPPISANVTLESDGKRLMLHSASEVNRCSLVVPCQVEGKARFAINLITLKEATKGRDEMEIVFDKTLCKISSKGFKIELPTFDALEIEAEKDTEKASVFKITSDQATWLSEALHAVALQPLKLVSKYMPLYIKLTDKGVFLTCYDDLHLAFVSSKEITGDMEVTLPIDVIAVVLDTFSASGFTMSVSSSSLEVSNKLARVSMSLPETSEGIQGSDVYDKSREILKAKGTEIISSRTRSATSGT